MPTARKKKGRYYARFYDSNRTPQRKVVALRTSRKSAAEKRLRRMEDACAAGNFDPWTDSWSDFGSGESSSLSEATDQFLEEKKRAGVRESTLTTYESKLNAFARHAPAGAMVQDIGPDHIRSYMYARVNQGQVTEGDPTNQTKRNRHAMVHMFLSWAEENDLIGENPTQKVSRPKKEKKEKTFFKTEEDMEKVLRAIDQYQERREGRPGPTPDVQWLKEMILVAVGTGLRRGELLNLRWRDLDLDSGRLKVCSREDFTPKNGHERTVPFCGDALDTLREMRDERDPDSTDPVFTDSDGHPVSARHPNRVSIEFKKYVRKTDLSYREELSFHSTRHTTASWLVMGGVSLFVVKEILGHEDIETTMVYSHLRPDVMGGAMGDVFGS